MVDKVRESIGELTLEGVSNGTVAVLARDAAGDILICSGSAAPSDAAVGYAKGCIFIQTDGTSVGGATSVMLLNIGSASSANFDPIATPA